MSFAYYLLVTAFLIAILTSLFPFTIYSRLAKPLVWLNSLVRAQFALLSLVFLTLGYAFLTNDFSLAYVVKNSNSHLPLVYRFCAIWGGHEGSLLLWVLILQSWTLMVNLRSRPIDVHLSMQVISVLGFISAGFLLFLITLSNPFLKLPVILNEGQDLNPLLQDPGLVFHPPLLYMGYVGFAVTFAYAVAGLWNNKVDKKWAQLVRPWTLAAWCFLTFGIVSGSWWAYRVLGWGGWWFWDPVENVSLMPWLAGAALLHSLAMLEKRNNQQHWVILLAIICFALSLLGTFIVRSGILISVHSFAVDPGRGIFMLTLLGIFVGLGLLLYGIKINRLTDNVPGAPFFSTEMFLLINNILLGVALFTILLGTLYPIIIEFLDLEKLSVGAPYFNRLFIPFAFLLLFFLGLVYQTEENKKFNLQKIKNIIVLVLLAFTISLAILKLFFFLQWRATLGLALAFWVLLNTLQSINLYNKKGWDWKKLLCLRGPMLLAHSGVAITAIGITLSTVYSMQRDVHMEKGDEIAMASHQFKLQQLSTLQKNNFTALIATLSVDGANFYLQPQLRYYPAARMLISKPAVNATFWQDYYVALAEPLAKQGWTLRFYIKPFIRWIWAGGLFMLLGGFWGIMTRRNYVYKKVSS